jgi:NAD(P)-dependent dehydrogenase (short-subunit alcohol dehydrogenase family)
MSLPSPVDLTGRRILVTGAAGGIGGATARLCAAQGADPILVDVAPEADLRERLGPLSESMQIHRCDTSQRREVDALAERIGPIHALVDCAAICPHDDWMADDFDEALDRVLAVNVRGPINLARAFLPGMIRRGEGRIVLCGSVAGWMGGLRSGPHYAFSKGGVHAFVRWLAHRGAPYNVLVNGIAPGPIETAMTDGRGYDPERYPLQRMGRPEEIGAMALFLCAPGASFVTGAIMDVNGAHTCVEAGDPSLRSGWPCQSRVRPGVGQHENLSKVDEIQIADLVQVDVVDQGVARALAIGAPVDPLQAVSALGAGRLDGGDVDRRRAGPRRGIRGEAAGAQRLRRTPLGPAPGPLLIHEQSWECLALKMARRINSLGLIEALANAMCLHC